MASGAWARSVDTSMEGSIIDTRNGTERSAVMNLVAAQEIKRRGMAAVDGLLGQGPVQIVKSNRARYVVMSVAEYDALLGDVAEARLAASEADWKAGRVKKGTAVDLMAEVRQDP